MNDVTVNLALLRKDISKPLETDKFGIFLSQEWKRLIQPFTPHREGNLDSPDVKPFEIVYNVPYDFYQYYGEDFNFRRDYNPYATYKWDKAAQKAGQTTKLVRAANGWLERNT